MAARRKRMATFTIDDENNITAYRPGDAIPEGDAERFASEKELGELAAQWLASRLVEVWNGIPGGKPVKKFTNRKTAVTRIWKAVQSLVSGPNSPHLAPKAAKAGTPATRNAKAHTAPDDSKKALLIRRLER